MVLTKVYAQRLVHHAEYAAVKYPVVIRGHIRDTSMTGSRAMGVLVLTLTGKATSTRNRIHLSKQTDTTEIMY